MRGTDSKPTSRANAAGKAALRSGLAVKRTEMTSDGVRPLAASISVRSSLTPAAIASGELATTWVAPRIARTDIREAYNPARLEGGMVTSFCRYIY